MTKRNGDNGHPCDIRDMCYLSKDLNAPSATSARACSGAPQSGAEQSTKSRNLWIKWLLSNPGQQM
eukprot:4060240-Pyramimonas_sp.AAC.1